MSLTQTNNGCFGISSRTIDDKHIVMVDADIKISEYNNFLMCLKQLQRDFELSEFYIFKTKHGFNAFTLDKVELELLTNMLYTQEIIDEKFIYFNDMRGYYTLKFNKDKTFIRRVDSIYEGYEKSSAHFIFFKDILNVQFCNEHKLDDNYIFEVINY